MKRFINLHELKLEKKQMSALIGGMNELYLEKITTPNIPILRYGIKPLVLRYGIIQPKA